MTINIFWQSMFSLIRMVGDAITHLLKSTESPDAKTREKETKTSDKSFAYAYVR